MEHPGGRRVAAGGMWPDTSPCRHRRPVRTVFWPKFRVFPAKVLESLMPAKQVLFEDTARTKICIGVNTRTVSSKPSDVAGDGTTNTATVLAQAIVRSAMSCVAAGMNSIHPNRANDKAVSATVGSATFPGHASPTRTTSRFRATSANAASAAGNVVRRTHPAQARCSINAADRILPSRETFE